ncbi:MAG: AmmeMemoRadiSam system radical SAM enzyme [Deltaproteobacteria bacterium]|nr:AmmeMemoRadiSam system radical SAM enzyme [Deltaproteobacteria bacterium]MBW1928545.1 AmmeMemoRadiSam system radical SAM enzyme [Deltaproteobacteria bacterium]MBW2025331.1 AmmeMemoRadiSam system radical SAM enzyme [Deltaproteobacteria bacterium]MBW2126392.1 AmmeMemoRadiSam system radical SAM enzyme [Deltaproteobacteria bacterium]
MAAKMTRKEFLKSLGAGAVALFCPSYAYALFEGRSRKSVKGHIFKGDAPKRPWKWSVEGYHYASNGRDVQCQICPNRCYLEPGDRSICRSKVNINGKLYSLAYGDPCAVHVDPIEKKPLFHFYPRSWIFSIATTGCNFRCLNCQNWEISQRKPEEVGHYELFPADVVKEAQKRKLPSIAYTYSEAITYYEYMYDTAKLARQAGINNVLVSNGYINHDPLVELCQYLDAANINLKSFDEKIYQCLNGGSLRPVLNTFKTLHQRGVWFEMTTLVVPTYVDDDEMIKRMCQWIVKELGPDYPLHFLRFFPRYKLTRLPPTPIDTLERLREVALREGIHYVYIGNVPGHEAESTYCHNCHQVLIERKGYAIGQYNLKEGRCKFCNTLIPGVWGE